MLNNTGFYAHHFLATPEGNKVINTINQTHPHIANMLKNKVHAHNHFMMNTIHRINGHTGSPVGSTGEGGAGGSSGF